MSDPGAPARGKVPPLWFFAVVGVIVTVAAVLVILRTGDKESSPAAVSPWPSAAPIAAAPPTAPGSEASPSSEAVSTLGASCRYNAYDYSIDYPEGWFTPEDRAWVCQLFDPQPFVVQPDTEPPIVAVSVYVERYPLSKVESALGDPTFYSVISSEQGTFADAARPGTIMETKATSQGLWPKGTRTFSVLVDRLNDTIVVSTNDLADSDYEQNKQIVLSMAESLRIAG